jgi:ankyrin repeat protein
LHSAATEGHKEIAELLIVEGANVNEKDKFGFTPLHDAAHEGHRKVAELLIAEGADVNLMNKDGAAPLHIAAYYGYEEIAELLIATKGADVNAKDKRGQTPLLSAAVGGHKEIAELLIAKGADVNAKIVSGPKQGSTPLDAANEVNHPETADLLRKHGGKTAEELKAAELVFEAAETRDIEVIKQILASTEGKWILKAIGKEQGQEFNDAGTVINKWNESKSELLMESKINRGERIIELVDIIKIDKGRILMDRGSHQLIGKWNSNEKTIVWNNKSGDFVFTGSSDFSEKQNIKEVFSVYRDGTQVFSVTADLKAEDK